MERVKGKQGRDHSTSPNGPGHLFQDNEQEQSIGEMKQQVGEVMAHGIEAVELAVKHMGQPSERVPIGCMGCGKGPNKTLMGKPSLNVRIFANVLCVVVMDKVMICHLPVDG
jgi:hypothetical protein